MRTRYPKLFQDEELSMTKFLRGGIKIKINKFKKREKRRKLMIGATADNHRQRESLHHLG